jgi:hypothetical protein
MVYGAIADVVSMTVDPSFALGRDVGIGMAHLMALLRRYVSIAG